MEQKSQGGRQSDYERNMESLGYEVLRKAKKRAIIWTIVFVAIIVFGAITAQMFLIGIGVVLTIVGLVFLAKRNSKLKDDMEVRKAGLAAYKKGHGNIPSETGPEPSSTSRESAPRTSRPLTTSSNSESRSASNVNTFSLKESTQARSTQTSSRTTRSEENVDTSVYGPIKGF